MAERVCFVWGPNDETRTEHDATITPIDRSTAVLEQQIPVSRYVQLIYIHRDGNISITAEL